MPEYGKQFADAQKENKSDINKAVLLFQFIKELNILRQKPVLNMSEHPWYQMISSFPNDAENISVFYRNQDTTSVISHDGHAVLLSVHQPEYEPCPEPDPVFAKWLETGWNLFLKSVQVMEQMELKHAVSSADDPQQSYKEADEETPEEKTLVFFYDSAERLEAFQRWLPLRNAWAERQKVIEQTRDLFAKLYSLYFDLKRDAETMELIVANGILRDKKNPSINHPILTQRVALRYEPTENTIYIEDTDAASALYTIAFQSMEDIHLDSINELQTDLSVNNYHPLDQDNASKFLEVFLRQLSSDSLFSKDGYPENWASDYRFLLYMEPCYIMRKRLDGTSAAIERILKDIQENGKIPAPIRDIVDGGKVDIPEEPTEEPLEKQLEAVGGESADVLLYKEANREQLEIAKRIELYNAVLVQGPPGTGKTHTIANLMGHFLAQGKSILVTSQTSKALNVLKDKVAPGLTSLCVSLLNDSSIDMERSIDGITSYVAKNSSYALKQDMDRLASERQEIIQELASVRKKIFRVIHRECDCIVYDGEGISPSKAAAYVSSHSGDLSYIPGSVKRNAPLPLTQEELNTLYSTNASLSVSDEAELATELPSLEDVLTPEAFSKLCEARQHAQEQLSVLNESTLWKIEQTTEGKIVFDDENRCFKIPVPDAKLLQAFENMINSLGHKDTWKYYAIADGKKSGGFRDRWERLIETIETACQFAESIVSNQFGNTIHFQEEFDWDNLSNSLKSLKNIFEKKGKLSKLILMFNRECTLAMNAILVNGHPIKSEEDCELALQIVHLKQLRRQCGIYWDELLASHGIPKFEVLDIQEPERIARNWIPDIRHCLDWYRDVYTVLTEYLEKLQIPAGVLFQIATSDSETVVAEKVLSVIEKDIPILCKACDAIFETIQDERILERNRQILCDGDRINSRLCSQMVIECKAFNSAGYREGYDALRQMLGQYVLQEQRRKLLDKLAAFAPDWAAAIQNRVGIHGDSCVPDGIQDAWKWKQLSAEVDDIINLPYHKLQEESVRLSKKYREVTACYAEKCAWFYLLSRTEGNVSMRQALEGWKQTIKKIGKGTGKNAPSLRAKARQLMHTCQQAVPCWIMPIGRALESLNTQTNKFDIVIIDEASQSDVSALAILYMGKKLIIVGDDKQVSPMAVGVETDKLNALQSMYIQGIIPNAHLYDGKTSIYDIAKTTFQPLMLREHFRCMPEIIGFSNLLSYDGKIKPLRDASDSRLLPAMVNYRVQDGKRLDNKTNPREAETIIALIKACIEQPEYAGKTFGVISLLGNEQVEVIQKMMEVHIDKKELTRRNILCGNASNFQGDERDVIFLSLVDSGNGKGPIRLQNFGVDDAIRKRYNVAVSRARDQLWVVDSIDSASDLKPGDIRKTLIDYSINPKAAEIRHSQIEKRAESPFEASVAKALSDRGYHLVQQWEVGAYRLDMVSVCGKKTVAIECDGEYYHSGEEKIREDMERQTILERLGWRFIRIRGSEYFRNPEKTIERVLENLTSLGIMPEDTSLETNARDESDLLKRVKIRAAQILSSNTNSNNVVDLQTISAALDSKSVSFQSEKQESVLEAISSEPKEFTDTSLKKEHPNTIKKQKEYPLSPPIVLSKKSEKIQDFPHKETPKMKSTVTSKQGKNKTKDELIQMTLPGMENLNEKADLLTMVRDAGISYIDKRDRGGALWIIGGQELNYFVKQCRNQGIRFTFKKEGGRATKGKPGWWTK